MTEAQTIQLFKCLSDATRLEMLRALSQGPKYVELLSERLQRSPSTISFHLKKLEEAGLVETRKEQYYVVASLKEDVLKQSLLSLVCPADEALDVLKESEIFKETMAVMMEKIQFYLDHRSYQQVLLGAVVFSDVHGCLGQTKDAQILIEKWNAQAGKGE